MNHIFCKCKSLTSLNLSNFDTSRVMSMVHIFYLCSLLTSLNLSNFNTSQVTDMSNMFYQCAILESINLNKFDENKLENYIDIFFGVPENIVICLNLNKNICKNKIIQQIQNKKCHIIYCSNNWKLKQKKIINNINACAENCDNKYEYNG